MYFHFPEPLCILIPHHQSTNQFHHSYYPVPTIPFTPLPYYQPPIPLNTHTTKQLTPIPPTHPHSTTPLPPSYSTNPPPYHHPTTTLLFHQPTPIPPPHYHPPIPPTHTHVHCMYHHPTHSHSTNHSTPPTPIPPAIPLLYYLQPSLHSTIPLPSYYINPHPYMYHHQTDQTHSHTTNHSTPIPLLYYQPPILPTISLLFCQPTPLLYCTTNPPPPTPSCSTKSLSAHLAIVIRKV